jgi:hypothetical protein
VVRFLYESRWGPVDFIKSTECVYRNLTNDMLHSPLANCSSQVFVFIRSCATAQYPVDVEEPVCTKLLLEVAYSALQRVNVATLLVHGGNEKIVCLLRERSAGVNALGYDLLKNAVEDSRLDIVPILVEHGARNEVEGIFTPLLGNSDLVRLSQMVETENDGLRQYLRDKLIEYKMDAGAADVEKEINFVTA